MPYISEAQNITNKIYKNSGIGIDYIYGYLSRNLGYLSIEYEEGANTDILIKRFVKSVSWILAAYNKLHADCIRCVLKKYPDFCPYCLSKPCSCGRLEGGGQIDPYNRKAEVREKYENYMRNREHEFDLDKLSFMLGEIYPFNENRWRECGKSRHFERIFQELAELHEAVSRYIKDGRNIDRILDEVSDILAWTLSAWRIIFGDKIKIENSLKGYYIGGCPVCGRYECSCAPREDRIDRVLSRQKIDELLDVISSIKVDDPQYEKVIHDFEKSLMAIKEENVGYVEKDIKIQARGIIDRLGEAAEKAGKFSQNASQIVSFVRLLQEIFFSGV